MISEGICVKAQGLHYSYVDKKRVQEALKGLSFEIRRGRITGLLGPNGSGKSTTFKILSTQLQPAQGEAWVNGHSVLSARAEVRRSIGVTFQSPSLDPILSVAENLAIHAGLFGLAGAAASTRIGELLALFNLAERRDARVKELSGGLARRAEIAKTLLSKPALLFLDEPTTGLDPRARLELWAELRRLRETGTTLIVSTHLMDEADLCDDLLFVADGRLAASGSPALLKKEFGRDVVTVEGEGAEACLARVRERQLAEKISSENGHWRLETKRGPELIDLIKGDLGHGIRHFHWGQATLGDVYLEKTGKPL